jgi:hypothetical protein
MAMLISVNQIPLLRFPSHSEAFAAVARSVATGHPVERIILTPVHEGAPTHDARRQGRQAGAPPAGGRGQAE